MQRVDIKRSIVVLGLVILAVSFWLQPQAGAQGNDAASQKDRISKYKASYGATLSAAQEARIKAKCKAAQGIATSLADNAVQLKTQRTKAYEEIVSQLSVLSGALVKSGNKDVAQLEEHAEALKKLVAAFSADIDTYKQALSDVATLDCAADPAAFSAAVQAARQAQAVAKDSAITVKTYVKNVIKPELRTMRGQAQGSSDESKTGGGQ